MFGLSIWELAIILAIVLLLFGTKRLKNLGSDLGSAIKGFRSAVTEEEKPAAETGDQSRVIEGEVDTAEPASSERKQESNV